MTTIDVREAPEERPEERRSEAEQRTETRPEAQQPQPEQPRPPQPAAPAAPAATPVAPPAPAIIPMRWSLAPPNPLRLPDRPAAPARPVYGPPDNRSAMFRDTERVGTAPNGEPLYAAEWYREPADDMMRSYLSTAHGPGWGLIACRTASEFRVEDCVGLDEYPTGSQILRSVLAMAWEFRVRPPRRGGQVLVGAWVRIRISYEIGRR
jgi:protein TonB